MNDVLTGRLIKFFRSHAQLGFSNRHIGGSDGFANLADLCLEHRFSRSIAITEFDVLA